MNFESEFIFHVYARANSEKDQLFIEHENYVFFLKKYKKYIIPVFDTLGYCLIPNHYHLLLRVKDKETIFSHQKKKRYKYYKDELRINEFLQQQFANFHISYAKAFNNQYGRRGSLFQPKPKAKVIKDINSVIRVCRYIHRNPIKHGLVNDLQKWQYSSYLEYLTEGKGVIFNKITILSCFESLKDFINYTNMEIDNYEESFEE